MAGIILASLKKRRKKFILVFIQFLIGLTVLMFGIYSVESFFSYQKNVREVLPLDTVHIFIEDNSEADGTESEMADETDVNPDDGIRRYKMLLDNIRKSKPDLKLGIFENILIEEESVEHSYFMCSREIFDIFKITDDSELIEQMICYKNEKVVPVLISNDLSERYSIGGTYSFPAESIPEFEKYQMKVIGVLEKDKKICGGGSSDISESIKTARKMIIGPELFDFDEISYTYNIVCSDTKGVDLETEFLNSGSDVVIKSMQDEIKDYYEREKTVMYGAIGFAAILLVLSVMGCMGTLLSMVLSRKEEFGIYFSLGMRKENLAVLILGEISIIFFVSYLLSIVLFGITVNISLDGIEYTPVATMVITLMVMFICAVLCAILPVKKMMGWKPIELLRTQRG